MGFLSYGKECGIAGVGMGMDVWICRLMIPENWKDGTKGEFCLTCSVSVHASYCCDHYNR